MSCTSGSLVLARRRFVMILLPARNGLANRGYPGGVLPGLTTDGARSLVVVAGSGRSGTSVFSGILQRLGYHVPQPEVPADETNPRGFAESQWVVDLHTRLLRTARVQVSDGRPAAWALTAEVGLDPGVRDELRTWLRSQFRISPHLIVKDPRLSWFLPLWRGCAEDLGVGPRFVTMLRHPAAVIESKQRWYGEWQGDVARAAGWVQQTLYTERTTRDSPRAFVRYEDLLDDWTRIVAQVGDALDLAPVRDAPAPAQREVHAFVDRGLARARPDWGDLVLPAALRAQADEVWELVSRLAGADADARAEHAAIAERLDALRGAYADLYAQAEAIAQSSIAAARARPPAPASGLPAPALQMIRRVPRRYRHSLPLHWRTRIARALARGA
jgi:hypothetical protein